MSSHYICGWRTLFSLGIIFILSGFSVERAIQNYQENHAQHYKCPHKGKSGSCSQLFLDNGLLAVMKKCFSLRAH